MLLRVLIASADLHHRQAAGATYISSFSNPESGRVSEPNHHVDWLYILRCNQDEVSMFPISIMGLPFRHGRCLTLLMAVFAYFKE